MPFFSQSKPPKMTRPSSSASPGRVAVQTVYFAYGSNLQLSQMARRCPESRYLGRGRLPDFKWQINTRGYANIYISDGDAVEGLCFLLSQKDEKRLDVSEGVTSAAYEKEILPVQVFAATASIAGRRVREVIETISTSSVRGAAPKYHSDTYETVNTLVYINWGQTTEGAPKTEYISRINDGISDAKCLGVPARYFDKYVKGPMERIPYEEVGISARSEPEQQQTSRRPVQSTAPEERAARLQKERSGRDGSRTRDSPPRPRSKVVHEIVEVESKQELVSSQSDSEEGVPDADVLHHSPEGDIHRDEMPGIATEEDLEGQEKNREIQSGSNKLGAGVGTEAE